MKQSIRHLNRLTMAPAQTDEPDDGEDPVLKPTLGEFLTLSASILSVVAEALLAKDQANSPTSSS